MPRSFVLAVLAIVALAACASNPGSPRWAAVAPRVLAPAAPPVAPDAVHIAMTPLPWWTVAESGTAFVLAFDESRDPAPAGRAAGAVRSSDVLLDADALDAVRCAWKIVPVGDGRPCPAGLERTQAMEIAHPLIARANDDLRTQAARAGANAVADVRCFAADTRHPHLWCEGNARVVALDAPAAWPGTRPGEDPTQPIDRDPDVRASRFLVVADGSVGMIGQQPVVGTTLGIRYHPIELGFEILDLSRATVAPQEGGRVGLGGTLLGRIPLGTSRFDAIVGGSALTTLQNGATNPTATGMYHGFAGIAYQTSWRIWGVMQPWVQLRGGASYDRATDRTEPMFGLHLGLSTPEQR